ncbi:gluconate transporter, partial [Vibrio vulnificus]
MLPLNASAALPAAVTQPWNDHDTLLVVVAVIAIALIVVLIAKFKMHPFLALTLGAAAAGLGSGVELGKVITNYEAGVGSVLQEV